MKRFASISAFLQMASSKSNFQLQFQMLQKAIVLVIVCVSNINLWYAGAWRVNPLSYQLQRSYLMMQSTSTVTSPGAISATQSSRPPNDNINNVKEWRAGYVNCKEELCEILQGEVPEDLVGTLFR